jgi:glycosyltransferase involved in cell wall biosynthesis
LSDLTVFVCTYNSSLTLGKCLSSIRAALPGSRLVIIDHYSSDGTVEIAAEYGAEVHYEDVSLGHARQLAFEMTRTELLGFVDSDVVIVQPLFFEKAMAQLQNPEVGAVVGMAVGHRLAYGLPAGLLVLRARDFRGKVIPDFIDARETFYIVRRLGELRLETVYLADSMVHESQFREFKPEWEGANTRIAAGVKLGELLFALKVIIMLSINSKNPKNIAYIPVFYIKFLRGFTNPEKWKRLARNVEV